MKTSTRLFLGGISAWLAASTARADVFTIAGVTFDTDNTVQSAAIVEGSINIQDYSSKIFARIEQAKPVLLGEAANPYVTFDRGRSLGRLLGRSGRRADDRARFFTFPEKGVRGAQPNKDRVTVELTWGKHGLPNRKGADFVVFEVGSFEAFAVAVRKAGSPDFSFYRYQFPSQSDPTHGVNAVVFDLANFGVLEGEVIDAVRIRNIFNSEALAGADKVDGAVGEGRVLYPTDVEYVAGHKLLSTVRGDEFRTDSLDADLIYAAALHKTVPLGTPAPAPTAPPAAN
jgi:hypothetical protein